jgi:phospholipase C
MTASIGPSNDGFSPTPDHPNQGGEAMGFYNMATGDAPYLKFLADFYAISDNLHQSIMGGTGANFFAISTSDVGFHTDSAGQADVPPLNQIENPNPVSGLKNWYTEDGYRSGSYVNCADRQQPGVSAIQDYLGDGTRIPLIVVSPYAKGGYVDHTYSDHASILKFIENNWKLAPLTSRSRDNLPNPITSEADLYVPVNSPAISDLMPLFTFPHP